MGVGLQGQDSDWIETVRQLAKNQFERSGQALLLTQVASGLRALGVDLPTLLAGRKLKAALESDGSEKLVLVQHPLHALTWGVMPAGTELPEKVSDLFPKPKAADPSSPMLELGFWSAFVKPLEPGFERYVIPHERPIRFVDLPKGETAPPSALEVLPKDVIASDLEGAAKSSAVKQNAAAWLSRHGLPADAFNKHKVLPARMNRRDWWERLWELPDEDLARISVPADILRKIM